LVKPIQATPADIRVCQNSQLLPLVISTIAFPASVRPVRKHRGLNRFREIARQERISMILSKGCAYQREKAKPRNSLPSAISQIDKLPGLISQCIDYAKTRPTMNTLGSSRPTRASMTTDSITSFSFERSRSLET